MKHFAFFVLSTVLSLSLISCSQDNTKSPQQFEEEIESKTITPKRTQNRSSRWDVETLVSENPNIFGTNVLVFDSLPCADTLLDILAESGPNDLRQYYTDFGFYNAIMESNIVYDSVMKDMAGYMNVNLEDDDLDENTLAWFLDAFVHEMMSNYSENCVVGEWVNGNNEVCYTVNPLGPIDERVLCNEKKLFIADGIVFKFSGNYLLTCSADTYLSLAQYDNLALLQQLLDQSEISGVTESDYIICELENDGNANRPNNLNRPNHNLTDDHTRHFREYDHEEENYMVDTYLTIYPYWSWFYTYFRCKLTISNYYKGTASKQKIGGHFKCFANGWYANEEPEDLWFLRNGQRFVNIWRWDINRYFKSRTLIESYGGGTYTPTTHTYVDIYELDLEVIQNGGSDHEVAIVEIE